MLILSIVLEHYINKYTFKAIKETRIVEDYVTTELNDLETPTALDV